MSNPYRNEIKVDLNKTEYTLRPTFECLAIIEETLKKPIFQIALDLQVGNWPTIKNCHFIIETAIKAAQQEVGPDLKRNIVDGGLNDTYSAIAQLINAGLQSGDLAKKN